ncbi:hypothetical protein Hdeb2414_s0019g00543711 [Helianthus debilis subsp. tardiflorus]
MSLQSTCLNWVVLPMRVDAKMDTAKVRQLLLPKKKEHQFELNKVDCTAN